MEIIFEFFQLDNLARVRFFIRIFYFGEIGTGMYTIILKFWANISMIGIPCFSGSRSWLNFFSKLLLVKKLKSGALIGQNRVEREPEEQGIPILDITFQAKCHCRAGFSIFYCCFESCMLTQNFKMIVCLSSELSHGDKIPF
jgi:hypothetical protein